MMDGNDDTTIGVGGWGLVLLSAVISFAVLHYWFFYHFIPAGLFSVAIALIVMLLLYRLAVAVNRYEDKEEAARIRKVVPAQADIGARIAGIEGASAPAARAVPVRPEAAVVPQRPAAVVTPLAEVQAPPVILPTSLMVGAEPQASAVQKAPPKPKAKAAAKPKADAKAEAKPKAAKAKAEPKAGKTAKPKAAKAAPPQGLVRLQAPRGGTADDLQEIEGIGPALEKLVNSLGFYHYDQIAAWTEADVALIDAEMKNFKGRITRDRWVEQARIITTDGLEAFRERARTNDY